MHIHIINERLNLLYAYFLRFNIWSLSVYIGMKKWWFTPQKCSNYSYYGMRLCDDDKTDFKLSCNVWLFDLLRVWIFFLFFKSPRCVTSDAFFGTETKKWRQYVLSTKIICIVGICRCTSEWEEDYCTSYLIESDCDTYHCSDKNTTIRNKEVFENMKLKWFVDAQ